jgi:hypothetical protein
MLHNDATYTMAELSQLIVDYFELGNGITDTLCFCYATHIAEERRRTYADLLQMVYSAIVANRGGGTPNRTAHLADCLWDMSDVRPHPAQLTQVTVAGPPSTA